MHLHSVRDPVGGERGLIPLEGVDRKERMRRWSTAMPPTESLQRELCTKNWSIPATERDSLKSVRYWSLEPKQRGPLQLSPFLPLLWGI